MSVRATHQVHPVADAVPMAMGTRHDSAHPGRSSPAVAGDAKAGSRPGLGRRAEL
jgi:hypothetical protein